MEEGPPPGILVRIRIRTQRTIRPSCASHTLSHIDLTYILHSTGISGEEITDGQLWQIDPTGERVGEALSSMASGIHRGRFESFAFDDSKPSMPYFYATKDSESGELERL